MKRYIYCMAIIAVVLYACNHGSPAKVSDIQLENIDHTRPKEKLEDPQHEEQLMAADTVAMSATDKNDAPVTNNNSDWNKKIIKTASLQLQLDDYKKFNANIYTAIKNFGAYIADEKQTQNDYRIENTVTIKVPVDQFDNLVNSFEGDGIKIIEKNISSEDVTGEEVDTKARLQAKLAVREKYLALLKQAKNMNEILQVQNEINEIQENIEAANGRINYLRHASAYSTINLDYFQYINGNTSKEEKPDFFTKLSRAFSTGTSVISNLILFCISIWPIILIVVVVIIFLKRAKPGKPGKPVKV